MPGYQVKTETVVIGGIDYRIRSLLDSNQYADPEGEASQAGISPASWPLFGLIWPSARVLALAMAGHVLHGKRVLEVGAGLALASLVVHRRGGDVTASDLHPLSGCFLKENLRLNRLPAMAHRRGDWSGANPDLGQFDLIIGSDVLYERQQPALLAGFISRHAAADAEILIVDPDRGNRPNFCREMRARNFIHSETRAARLLEDGTPYKGCIISCRHAA